MKTSEYIAELVNLIHAHGVHTVVSCPGSRNAPLSLALARHGQFTIYPIVDERSAAFYAMGIAQQQQKPVLLHCTSGSASLNFAPALAEAYYQKIPLLVFTADRPEDSLDQLDGQMINQRELYKNYIRASFHFPEEQSASSPRFQERMLSEAIHACSYPIPGPVHINLPFREPLYDKSYRSTHIPKPILLSQSQQSLSPEQVKELSQEWKQYNKVLIIIGQHHPCPLLESQILRLSKCKQVSVLAESTSNLPIGGVHQHIDRMFAAMPIEQSADFLPDLVITLGGHIVSRHVKQHLLKHNEKISHWHIGREDRAPDYFKCLERFIALTPSTCLEQLLLHLPSTCSSYADLWVRLEAAAEAKHQEALQAIKYSDLQVFGQIVQAIPAYFQLQLGNSTPVRYMQLFARLHPNPCFSNRGTSGIDGAMSTACGAALASQKSTLFITGDQGFFYDSNALWNQHLPKHIHILVINNGGGGIFRFIDGPSEQPEVAKMFQLAQNYSVEHICRAFGLHYQKAEDLHSLHAALPSFFSKQSAPKVLEVFTNGAESGQILKNYFQSLRISKAL